MSSRPCGGLGCMPPSGGLDLASPPISKAAMVGPIHGAAQNARGDRVDASLSFHSNRTRPCKAKVGRVRNPDMLAQTSQARPRHSTPVVPPSEMMSSSSKLARARSQQRGIYHIEDQRVGIRPMARSISATELNNVNRRRVTPSTNGTARVSSKSTQLNVRVASKFTDTGAFPCFRVFLP
jgi:hypothetical protein